MVEKNILKFSMEISCPVCREGSLVLIKCPECGFNMAVCDEDGSIFPNLKEIGKPLEWSCDIWISTQTKCPSCEYIGAFLYLKENDLKEVNFKYSKYNL